MAKNIPGLKRGWSYREGTAGSGGLGLYVDGLMVAEYENYNDQLMITYGKSLTGVPQGIYEESATQNYDIGTKRVVDDMVFHYCQAEADSGSTYKAIQPNRAVVTKHIPVTASAVTAASVGATTITATVSDVAANNYADGYIIQQNSPWTQNSKLRIKSNTTTVFTLKDPLVLAVGASDSLHFSKNMYKDVGMLETNATGKEYHSWAAVPLLGVTAEYYFWGQTWGPCCVQYGVGTPHRPGESPSERSFAFDYYGAAIYSSDLLAAGNAAGWVIPNTWGTWSMLMMLRLAP